MEKVASWPHSGLEQRTVVIAPSAEMISMPGLWQTAQLSSVSSPCLPTSPLILFPFYAASSFGTTPHFGHLVTGSNDAEYTTKVISSSHLGHRTS